METKPARWQDEAACHDIPPETFFPVSDEEAEIAKTICFGQCAVRSQCLDYALQHKEEDGIWGGFTEKERRKIIRRRSRTA